MKKFNHIELVILIVSIFLVSAEFIKFIRENIFYFLIFVLIVLILIFLRNKSKYDSFLTIFILFVYVTSYVIFKDIDQPLLVLRTSSILAFLFINLVILIGPWSRFSERVLRFYCYRRHLGVTTLFLAGLHVAIVMPYFFNLSIKEALLSGYSFYGFAAFLIIFFMGLSSWDYIQKKFKQLWWNLLHVFLLFIFIGMSYYFIHLQIDTNNLLLKYNVLIISSFILFWLIIAPYSVIKKILKTWVSGWKQLHVLVYIAYFSIIFHVAFGGLLSKLILLKLLFYCTIIFTLGSHGYGWIKKISEDNQIKKQIKLIDKKVEINNSLFIGIAHVKDFKEDIGKKFIINERQIAVFKHESNFFAISNVCAHQKGPLYKGKITYGFVECPWHHYQFNIKNGKGPSKFCDFVPYYQTKIIENIVFVSTKPVT